ncbi:MAG: hypothetical protein JNM07_12460 [Phycisphaerae bacterium]|nr:hypothetical protein [Phycisphaerae bacterium]
MNGPMLGVTLAFADVPEGLIQLIAVGGAFAVPIVGIIAGMVYAASKNKQREQSRREIAAYVAEGSITPDHARMLLDEGEHR